MVFAIVFQFVMGDGCGQGHTAVVLLSLDMVGGVIMVRTRHRIGMTLHRRGHLYPHPGRARVSIAFWLVMLRWLTIGMLAFADAIHGFERYLLDRSHIFQLVGCS